MNFEVCQENLKKTKGNFDVYMKKRFLTICIAAFALVFGMGVFSACNTESEQGPSLEYAMENGGYKVVGIGSYEDGELVIPSKYKGKPVTAIGAEAFVREREIGILTIPDSVQVIEDKAFSGCANLTKVTIGNGVTDIGAQAFAHCNMLESITLSNSLVEIGEKAFLECLRLRTLTLPDTLQVISGSAFAGCERLRTVDFGSGLRVIGEKAFYDCELLESVEIPDGARTDIGVSAFMNCSSIRYVSLGNDVVSVGASAFTRDEMGNGMQVREVVLGDKVYSVGAKAFDSCRKLCRITLGKSLKEIGSSAFNKCYALREILNCSTMNVEAGSSSNGGVGAFAWYVRSEDQPTRISIDENGLIYYTDGARKALVTVDFLDTAELIVPDDVTEIAPYACYNEQYITAVIIGNGCTKIGEDAFRNSYNIREVRLGDSLAVIGARAFMNNMSISTMVFGSNVQSVGERAFDKKGEYGEDGFKNYRMYFKGTQAQWLQISFATGNEDLTDTSIGSTIAFYSESEPARDGLNYWRYEGETPTLWK